MKTKQPILLCILDGFGIAKSSSTNAISSATKPNLDYLLKTYPHTEVSASGLAVGLPEGQMGNSEVGHLQIGAGRVIYQSLTLINKSINDKTFLKMKQYCQQLIMQKRIIVMFILLVY